MVWRQQFGERNGVYGGWISKPGFDVTNCTPGNFLLDTNAQVFQCVLSGDTTIMTEGSATVPVGTYRTSVALPAAFAPYSNLIASVIYYQVFNPSGQVTTGLAQVSSFLRYNITGGVLNLSVTLRFAGGGYAASSGLTFVHRARWSVFRAQF